MAQDVGTVTTGKLTTHILDTARGVPAEGVVIELFHGACLLKSMTTNADGRVDGPILEGGDLTPGHYELRFHAGDYLRRTQKNLAEPLFLDVIPIHFGIANANQHYHVPLLLSPFGFSTYRGS
jgi:5-hydroxyisourate hydrolase